MNKSSNNWKEHSIDDLRVINSEEFIDDEGHTCYCIYSFSLDSMTFVNDEIIQLLRQRGIQELEDLPT